MGEIPLFTACKMENKHECIIKYLIEMNVDVNKENKDGETQLHIMCKKKKFFKYSIIKFFLPYT